MMNEKSYNYRDRDADDILMRIGKTFDDHKNDRISENLKNEEPNPLVFRGEVDYATGEIKVKDAIQGTIW